MSKVITFSRYFQKSHPKAGEPTYFVEKLWKSLGNEFVEKEAISIAASFTDLRKDSVNDFGAMKDIHFNRIMSFEPKLHTIRGGQRFKVGDKFSPRVWTDKPYNSPQSKIADDLEVKKVFSIRVFVQDFGKLGLQSVITINGKDFQNIELLAKNDGLSQQDFLNWFILKNGETFVGQIICWDEVSY
jgi:hypothetical protein